MTDHPTISIVRSSAALRRMPATLAASTLSPSPSSPSKSARLAPTASSTTPRSSGTARSPSAPPQRPSPVSDPPPVQFSNLTWDIVDFDTGSSDLFLPGPSCGSTCSGHTIYDPSSSSTSKSLGKSFSLAYGDGSTVSGTQYTDKVSIAGISVSPGPVARR